jgi:hypothetical protein
VEAESSTEFWGEEIFLQVSRKQKQPHKNSFLLSGPVKLPVQSVVLQNCGCLGPQIKIIYCDTATL